MQHRLSQFFETSKRKEMIKFSQPKNEYGQAGKLGTSSNWEQETFGFKCGRKKETDGAKEENVILMEESEDEDFGSFQQEMEVAEMEDVIYLESSMADFSINLFVLIYNLGGTRIKAHYSYVCGIEEIGSGEYDMPGLKTTTLAKSKFVSVVNNQFAISESRLKSILPDLFFEVYCGK
ncbi:hypothetical protein AVEN_259039-1 [Araneus ventricosus]|uniref:Uncharacterized protein n=1 Tax=Araneus ventricosus TaxID=182803 RepID=A0A4Y2PNA4_ARAVE|nr:hypothetical protein AVEN_259039-1 [Araneus ventricosus]